MLTSCKIPVYLSLDSKWGYAALIAAITPVQRQNLIMPKDKDVFKVAPGLHASESNTSNPLKLTAATLKRLTGGTGSRWLSQDLHDSLARFLNRRYPHLLCVKTDYTSKLLEGEHRHVRKWLSNREVLEAALPRLTDQPAPTSPVTHILFTIHQPSHWVLAILDLTRKQFTHLNSLNDGEPDSAGAKSELDALKTHISQSTEDGAVIPWAPDLFPDIPQQRGGIDCGVFTQAWSACIGLGVDPAEVRQEHMSNLRERFLLRILLPAEDTLTT
jgi:hypothetical protein